VSNYRQIFKSTALLGGTQVILTIIGLGRNKVLAVLLGPAGVGLAGLYTSITTLVGTLTGFGIGNSGVRQIAEANRLSDKTRVARIAKVISRVLFLTNIIGALIICFFSRPICQATFGDKKYAFGVALMSLVLLFMGISAGQMTILQGLLRIKDLVSCQILGSVFGTLVSIIIIYFLRERGVAWFLVANAAFAILTSWWFTRQIQFVPARVGLVCLVKETRILGGLGIALMSAGLLASVVAYFTRLIIIRQLGLQSTGQFQAANTLSSYYVGFILSAMGTDFYPRLSGLCNDNPEANRLMNEQVEIGLMLATPGITATLVLAPWVLRVFYTGSFVAAADIVQWQVIGVFFRMISWPLWHIQMAKGLGRLFVITESTSAGLQILLNWICIRKWGLEGVGMAFALFYMIHIGGMYILCRRLSRFTWSRRFFLISLPGAFVLALSFAAVKLLPVVWGVSFGLGMCLLSCLGSFHGLQKVLGVNIKSMILKRFTPNPAQM